MPPYLHKRNFTSFENALTSFNLTSQQKVILNGRYLPLIRHLHYRASRISIFFHTSRTIITVGSLLVPAHLSIQYTDGVATTEVARQIYWATWVISLLVTMCNGLITLFKLDKRYYYLFTTLEHMVSEGWQFLELTGKYSGYHTPGQEPTHANQFIFFCATIEKIRMKQVEEEYFKLTEKDQPGTGTQQHQNAALPSTESRTQSRVPPTPLQADLARIPPEILAVIQQLSQSPIENAGSRQDEAVRGAATAATPRPTAENPQSQSTQNRSPTSMPVRVLV